MNHSKQNQKDKYFKCDNCGIIGHDYKNCKESVTSWGIILVKMLNNELRNKISDETYINSADENAGIKLRNVDDLSVVTENMELIKFLLIRRKHSLGYTEFIRGNYIKDNINGIIYLFQQMTPGEIHKISTNDFDTLWKDFWGSDTRKKSLNKKQYMESKEKFESLQNKNGVELSIDFYIKNVTPLYNVAEYGLPKGRQQRGESDIECAMREFCEETGYSEHDVRLITNVKPIIENMTGTNGVSYRFVYYLAEDISNNVPSICERNANEVGDIGFFTYDETQNLLRDYHIEKKNVIKNVYMYYLNNLLHKNEIVEISQAKENILFTTDHDEF